MASVIGEIFWRQAVADLHSIAATYPPDMRREIALAELTTHIHAARFDDALTVGERLLMMMQDGPPRVRGVVWLDVLAWLVFALVLVACFALANR